MGATVDNGAETPVQDPDELDAITASRSESDAEPTYEERLAASREEAGIGDGFFDSQQGGEKVPQTHTLKFTGATGDGAPPDLRRGEFVYFEGVAKVTSAAVKDKLDKETFVTLEAVKVIEATVTDLRFDRGHDGPELDPDQTSLGL